jgi:hypothetical protein
MGWIGVILITFAYFLVSFGMIVPSGYTYQLLNLFGAMGIVVSSYIKRDMQPVVLNIFWGIIAFVAIVSLLF